MAKLARHAFATLVSLLFVFMWIAAGNPDPFGPWIAAFAQAAPCGPNPVACENRLAGDADFEISGAGGSTIQGFATDISVNVGHAVTFKIDAPGAASYSIPIYRLGYYGGAGARKVATITPSALPEQPACLTDAFTGLVDCGNWAVSAAWNVPADAVSGIYVAKPTRPDNGESSHIVFIVRNDSRAAEILVQASDTTWQAYNRYGGASLYCADNGGVSNAGSAYANSCAQRATKVSYNRPFDTRAHSPQSFLFNAEYPMLRFLEANGYDVKYWAGVDTDRRASDLLGANKPKLFMSSGHDEYWSSGQRAAVEAARNAGMNLAFFSGNEVYWKTRWEPSAASADTATSNPAYRTLVAYKDTLAGVKLDPEPNVATGTWRDTRFAPPIADGGRPENALIGSIWTVNSGTTAITVPPAMANLRLWRNTRIAQQGGGTLAPSTLGYEWGEDLDNGARPAGLVRLSATTVPAVEKIVDFGSTVANGTATHHLTLYRHQSGALVFGASTVQWAWGLDASHDDHAQSLPSHTPDLAMQQATVNLLADMGAQPASLQPNLVGAAASTDDLAPTTIITAPAAGSSLGSGDRVAIGGTASDAGGGRVAAVEVSIDDGRTWRPAQGTAAWSFEWSPGVIGAVTLRARAIDDSGNKEATGASAAVTVTAGRCPCTTLWNTSAVPAVPDVDDSASVEVGLKFKSDIDGFIKGVRFYKSLGNSGTHVGNLWTTAGELLARANFVAETPSGWQQVLFAQPVAIDANTIYVVSYHTNVGHYAASGGYFNTTGVDAPPLRALPSGAAGGNGVFKYGPTDFPTDTFNASNYWVDVVFDGAPDTTKPVIADVHATTIDSTTAMITWSTNEPATSIVEYSTESTFPAALTLRVSDAGLVTAHSMRVAGLRANTRYWFRLKSADRAGNEGTWPPAGPDPQPGSGGTPSPRDFTTPQPMLHDTTTADFAAGASTSIHVAEAEDGELVLAPATGVEFSGSALPAGWSSTIWSPGGTATLGNGRLVVDGARVVRDQVEPLAGHSLEFVATFTGDPYQHSGYGQTLASTFEPLALFSTSWVDVDGTPRAGGSLAARTSIGDGSELSTNLGPSFFNAPHRYRIDWQPAGVTYYVDGVPVASHTIAIPGQLRPVAASDFNAFSGAITVDWIRISPYAATGSFVSRVFGAGSVVDWNEIQWTADVPAGTSLAVAVRGGATPDPDATWTGFAPISAPGPFALRSQYVQYRVTLATDEATRSPALQEIAIRSTPTSLSAVNDHAVVPENGNHLFPASGIGSLTANDIDSSAPAALRVTAVTQPAHGTAVVNADGSVSYTPATNYHGADSFGYTVSDGLLTAQATVSIDVFGNIKPNANADRYDANEDATLTVTAASGLLANDTDAEHDPLTVRLVLPPAHGVLALHDDGSFSYTPGENYAGADEFTYKANDGVDDSAGAVVRITVAPINDPPSFTAGPDQVVLEDASAQAVIGWATNISAGNTAESSQAVDFIVETASTALFSVQPAIAPNGTLTYTPAPNASGSATISVRIHDNGGSNGIDTSAAKTFSIAVLPVNDAPTFVKGADQTVPEGAGPQTVAAWATAISAGADNESDQALDFIVATSNSALFTVAPAVSPDGRLSYTPAPNANGSAVVTVRLHDDGGAANGGRDTSAVQSFTITIRAANTAPTVTLASSSSSVNEGTPVTLVATGTDADPGDTLSFAWDLDGDGTFETAGASSITFTPANGPATLTPKVRVTDRGGLTSGAAVSITVANVAPVVSDTVVWNGDATIVEPVAKARSPFTASVAFSDAGTGDKHTVTYSWGDGSTTSAAEVTVTEANGSGNAVGTHIYMQTGFYTVTVTVSDGTDAVTKTARQTVVVVDTAGKSLTGSGTFTSPAGSYPGNPALAGSATFNALTAKYGADGTLTTPGGTNAFRFTYSNAGLSFTSTKMTWLVVNGAKTWLKGDGNVTVGGVTQAAEYLVAAVDATAAPNVDKVRVRIVSKGTGQVIYDTQKNAVSTADATTPTPIYVTVSLK